MQELAIDGGQAVRDKWQESTHRWMSILFLVYVMICAGNFRKLVQSRGLEEHWLMPKVVPTLSHRLIRPFFCHLFLLVD